MGRGGLPCITVGAPFRYPFVTPFLPPAPKSLTNPATPAFNAALTIFGSFLLPAEDSPTGADSDRASRATHFLDKAIEALVNLDKDNRVIDRCVDYLKQLSRLASGWGEYTFNIISASG